jgi:hypothetical protein
MRRRVSTDETKCEQKMRRGCAKYTKEHHPAARVSLRLTKHGVTNALSRTRHVHYILSCLPSVQSTSHSCKSSVMLEQHLCKQPHHVCTGMGCKLDLRRVQRSSPEIFSGFGKVPTLGIFDPLFVVICINARVLEAEPFVVNVSPPQIPAPTSRSRRYEMM